MRPPEFNSANYNCSRSAFNTALYTVRSATATWHARAASSQAAVPFPPPHSDSAAVTTPIELHVSDIHDGPRKLRTAESECPKNRAVKSSNVHDMCLSIDTASKCGSVSVA